MGLSTGGKIAAALGVIGALSLTIVIAFTNGKDEGKK